MSALLCVVNTEVQRLGAAGVEHQRGDALDFLTSEGVESVDMDLLLQEDIREAGVRRRASTLRTS